VGRFPNRPTCGTQATSKAGAESVTQEGIWCCAVEHMSVLQCHCRDAVCSSVCVCVCVCGRGGGEGHSNIEPACCSHLLNPGHLPGSRLPSRVLACGQDVLDQAGTEAQVAPVDRPSTTPCLVLGQFLGRAYHCIGENTWATAQHSMLQHNTEDDVALLSVQSVGAWTQQTMVRRK
jgi:hypothetical protein